MGPAIDYAMITFALAILGSTAITVMFITYMTFRVIINGVEFSGSRERDMDSKNESKSESEKDHHRDKDHHGDKDHNIDKDYHFVDDVKSDEYCCLSCYRDRSLIR